MNQINIPTIISHPESIPNQQFFQMVDFPASQEDILNIVLYSIHQDENWNYCYFGTTLYGINKNTNEIVLNDGNNWIQVQTINLDPSQYTNHFYNLTQFLSKELNEAKMYMCSMAEQVKSAYAINEQLEHKIKELKLINYQLTVDKITKNKNLEKSNLNFSIEMKSLLEKKNLEIEDLKSQLQSFQSENDKMKLSLQSFENEIKEKDSIIQLKNDIIEKNEHKFHQQNELKDKEIVNLKKNIQSYESQLLLLREENKINNQRIKELENNLKSFQNVKKESNDKKYNKLLRDYEELQIQFQNLNENYLINQNGAENEKNHFRKMLDILENTITLKDKTNKQLEFSLADAEIRRNEYINKYKELVLEKKEFELNLQQRLDCLVKENNGLRERYKQIDSISKEAITRYKKIIRENNELKDLLNMVTTNDLQDSILKDSNNINTSS